MTIEETLKEALQLHNARKYSEAEELYRQVLTKHPNQSDALHLLGVLNFEQGRHDAAIDFISRAMVFRPDFFDAKVNLGTAYQQAGRINEAIETFQQAIKINPNVAGVHVNLGNALQAVGRAEQAAESYRRAIALDPNLAQTGSPSEAEAHYNRGLALKKNRQINEAITAYQKAIWLKPDYSQAWTAMGIAMKDKGQFAEAIAAHRKAISINPNLAEAYGNLGIALKHTGRLQEAIDAFQQSIGVNPNLAVTHSNLGVALEDAWRIDEAVAAYRRAIALNPNSAGMLNNLGTALTKIGRLDEALAVNRQALALEPGNAVIHSDLIFRMNYHPATNAPAMAEQLSNWNRAHVQPLRQFILPHSNDVNPDRRLRVGYVSPDFCDHAVGNNLLPLFFNHDRRQFEIFCYADVRQSDSITEQFRQHSDQWRSIVGLTDEQVAEQIRDDRIDILVDLAMHTGENRLLAFARKPAPVQMAGFAYPGSTGLETIDYRLTDAYLDPPGMFDTFYAEQSIRLPDTFWCYDPRLLAAEATDVGPLPALKNGFVTFGSLNNIFKLNERTLDLWAPVLAALPDSRLILMAPPGSVRNDLLNKLQQRGIAPDRVELVGRQSRTKYLQVHHRIDIGLDTIPYNGHTTSLDSIWMGVPVVTLIGSTVVGRAGWSQLCNLGLKELAAQTPQQFTQIVTTLAKDLPRLAELRADLRRRMEQSPLMDAPRFTRNIESAYQQVWRKWCEQQR